MEHHHTAQQRADLGPFKEEIAAQVGLIAKERDAIVLERQRGDRGDGELGHVGAHIVDAFQVDFPSRPANLVSAASHSKLLNEGMGLTLPGTIDTASTFARDPLPFALVGRWKRRPRGPCRLRCYARV